MYGTQNKVEVSPFLGTLLIVLGGKRRIWKKNLIVPVSDLNQFVGSMLFLQV
jgi:hypothetical protein